MEENEIPTTYGNSNEQISLETKKDVSSALDAIEKQYESSTASSIASKKLVSTSAVSDRDTIHDESEKYEQAPVAKENQEPKQKVEAKPKVANELKPLVKPKGRQPFRFTKDKSDANLEVNPPPAEEKLEGQPEVEEKEEVKDPNKPYDEEIDGIKAPPGVNPQALKQLRDVATKYKGEAGQLRPQLVQLQNQIAELTKQTGKLPEPVEKELKDLRAHRLLYDVINEPTFKAAYDDKIDLAQNQLYSHLKACGLPDVSIDDIKAKGGLLNFKMPSGELLIDSQWWNENIRNKMTFSQGSKYEALMKSALGLKDGREQTIENIKNQREKFEEDRKTIAKQMYQQDMGAADKIVQDFRQKIPWARIQDIPVDATPELRKAIEEDNAFVPELEKRFQEAFESFNEKNINKKTQVAATYALAHKQMEMLKAGTRTLNARDEVIKGQNAEIQRLTNELQKIRNAGKTTQAASTTNQPNKPKVITEDDYSDMKPKQAVEARLKAMGV